MADIPDLAELLRRNLETGARFYQGLARLSADYLRDVGATLTEAQRPAEEEPPAATQPATAPRGASLVLEAEAGQEAQGFFLVSNRLSRRVEAKVVASPLIDSAGNEVKQALYCEPATVKLGPGEQTVVRVAAQIGDRLEAGVGYRGALTVPGVSDSAVALVVRRRHAVGQPAAAEAAPRKTAAKGAARKKTRAKKKAAPKKAAARKKAVARKAKPKKAARKKAAPKAAPKKKRAARARPRGKKKKS